MAGIASVAHSLPRPDPAPSVLARRRPRGVTFTLAVLSGALVALSLPPFGWWPLGWLGLAGFALLLAGPCGAGLPLRARAAVGAGVGLGQFAIGLWWATDFQSAGYVGLVLHGMAATTLAGALVPASRRWGLVTGLPAAWVLTDWLRSHYPAGGLPIGGAALGQAASPLAPVVRLGGGAALVGITALLGAGLAQLALAAWPAGRLLLARRPRVGAPPADGAPAGDWAPAGDGAPGPSRLQAGADLGAQPGNHGPVRSRSGPAGAARGPLLAGVVALAVVVAVVVAARLSPDGAGPGPHRTLRVAAVQGGGERGLRSVDTDPQQVTQRQLDATAALRPPLDLVLWPEDVVHVDGPIEGTPQAASVAAVAERLHTVVVAGVVEEVGGDRFRNAAIAWSPQGTIVARYDKVHRVPFGEYVPARALVAHVANLSLIPEDAIAGHGPGLLPTPAGPLGVVISYEVFYDELARGAIKAGGQVLLVPTNAASYRSSQVPTQEVAASRLRALETGRDLVQASPTGYTAFVDHNGKVTERGGLGSARVLIGTVEARTGQTIFVRFGEQPILIGLLVWLAVAWGLLRRPAPGRRAPDLKPRRPHRRRLPVRPGSAVKPEPQPAATGGAMPGRVV